MKVRDSYILPESLSEMDTLYGVAMSGERQKAELKLPAPIQGVSGIKLHPKAVNVFNLFFQRIYDSGHWHCLKSVDVDYFIHLPIEQPPAYCATAYGAGVILNRGKNQPGQTPPLTEPTLMRSEKPGAIFWHGHPVVEIATSLDLIWHGDNKGPEVGSLFCAGETR